MTPDIDALTVFGRTYYEGHTMHATILNPAQKQYPVNRMWATLMPYFQYIKDSTWMIYVYIDDIPFRLNFTAYGHSC